MDRRRIIESITQAKAELAIHTKSLKEEFGVDDLESAKSLLDQLETKQAKLEKKLDKAIQEYETKWERLLNE